MSTDLHKTPYSVMAHALATGMWNGKPLSARDFATLSAALSRMPPQDIAAPAQVVECPACHTQHVPYALELPDNAPPGAFIVHAMPSREDEFTDDLPPSRDFSDLQREEPGEKVDPTWQPPT